MKILHISKYYYPSIGGIENICKYIVEHETEHETAVVCFNEGHKDVVDEINGHRIYRVATWLNVEQQALSPSYFTMLRRAFREFHPEVIHFHWANPFPAAVLLTLIPKDMKLIVHWHMDIIEQRLIYSLIKPVERALLQRADLVIVTSPNYRDGSLPLQPFKKKVCIVPNTINEAVMMLRPGDEEAIERIRTKYHHHKIVFFVGRHVSYKGLSCLLEAERMVQEDCAVVIAGSGPLTAVLKAACSSERVFFVGRLSDDELRWYHHAASIFAFPSITKNEAFGVALAEAMYAYTPAVTFHIPGSGVNWVSLHGETGLEAPNGDCRAYAEAIDTLLSHPEMAKRMGEAGHNRVKDKFTTPFIKHMNKCYDSISKIKVIHT